MPTISCVSLFGRLGMALALAVAGTAITGNDSAGGLPSRLQARITATWQGQQLATVIERIGSSHAISFWLDRRVDPQLIINAQLRDLTLAEAFDQVLGGNGLGWSMWDEIVYVGPPESAAEIATLMAIARQSIGDLPPARRAAWMERAASHWPRLTAPRQLLVDWLADAQVSLENAELITHDLWAEGKLPAMPLVDRVVLLLAGFDTTCSISADGRTCRIVPVRRPVQLTQELAPGNRMRELLSAFRENEGVTVNRRGNRVEFTGRWEDYLQARAIIAGTPPERPRAGQSTERRREHRFSLTLVNQPVGKVIDQLAGQWELAVHWALSANEKRNQLVSCDVRDATRDQLLTEILAPAGLAATIRESTLAIRLAE